MYTVKHKPTNQWVKINQHLMCPEVELYGYKTSLQLVEEQSRATAYINLATLKEDVYYASYLEQEDYGKNNFSEFEFVEQIS